MRVARRTGLPPLRPSQPQRRDRARVQILQCADAVCEHQVGPRLTVRPNTVRCLDCAPHKTTGALDAASPSRAWRVTQAIVPFGSALRALSLLSQICKGLTMVRVRCGSRCNPLDEYYLRHVT